MAGKNVGEHRRDAVDSQQGERAAARPRLSEALGPKGGGPEGGGLAGGGAGAPSTNEVSWPSEQEGKRRKSRTRARTISIRRLSKAELNRGREQFPEFDYWRPQTRADCAKVERPCPYVSCKYHLYIDVHPVRGSIKVNFPDLEVWEMTDTCALDVADRGGITLEEVGEIMNLTRERVRQVETAGLSKLHAADEIVRLREYVG